MVSVPLEGPTGEAGADAAEGVLLAVEDAGSPVQVLVEDAGPGPCGRNVPVNAERAAANADVVAYLGEFHSAATEMALPCWRPPLWCWTLSAAWVRTGPG